MSKSDPRGEAAAAEYGRQLAQLDLDALEIDDDESPSLASGAEPEPEPEPEHEHELEALPIMPPPSREASLTSRPNLEPIDEDAHPPQNRRIPTQPPDALALALDGVTEAQVTRGGAPSPEPAGAPGAPGLPPPPKLPYPRSSPTPTAVARPGLFTDDRVTNLLAGAAIGLLLAVFPAKKLAQSYETSKVVPRLADLETSVAQTLAVDAGLVERPESVVASIDEGRGEARQRFILVWLLAGLPIGAGLGFAPRFWE